MLPLRMEIPHTTFRNGSKMSEMGFAGGGGGVEKWGDQSHAPEAGG